jgi:hypothetical protein
MRNHSRDDTPCTLYTKLLKKGSSNNPIITDISVRVEQGAASYTHDDYAESSAEDLRRVADYLAAKHGTEVSDDLSDGDSVSGKAVFIFEHGRIEVLRTVGLLRKIVCQ